MFVVENHMPLKLSSSGYGGDVIKYWSTLRRALQTLHERPLKARARGMWEHPQEYLAENMT
jgi:hypothetical protein